MPADPANASNEKSPLRLDARARRRAASELFGPRIGPVLAANFAHAFALPADAVVAGYHAVGDEADIDPLMTALHSRGHVTGLPRVAAPGAPLAFHAWAPGDDLVRGFKDIPEPDAGTAPIEPDVLLVPLLAYDARGHRLGYGGGYYDRTLEEIRARRAVLAIGIAYSAQRVDSLPGAAHDQRLDAVLTELGVERFTAKDGP